MNTIIFDMDGVIIDSEPIHRMMQEEMFNKLGITLTDQEHFAYVGKSTKNMWEDLRTKFNLHQSIEDLLAQDKEKYFAYLRKNEMQPIPGVYDFIKECYNHNYMLILASSASMENIDIVLNLFSLSTYFTYKISGAELLHSKPHPEIFLKACSLANVTPENCLVIEDSENGVNAAKTAGMFCVGFQSPHSGNQNLINSDWIINSFKEINVAKIKERFRK